MHTRFKNCCRLCATEVNCSKNILDEENESTNLREAIEKHFSLLIDSNNEEPTKICSDCYEFLLKLIEFEAIVLRSQIKFQSVVDIKEEEVNYIEMEPYNDEYSEEAENFEEINPCYEECSEENGFEPSQHMDIQNESTSCESSDQKLHSENNLKVEYSTKKLTCNLCGKLFGKPSTLLSHQKLVHSNVRKYICDECGKTFKRSGDLSRHKDFHRDDTPFACRVCSKKFKSKLVVANHEKIHTEQRFSCTKCGQELKSKNSLRGHMQIHSDIFQFKCTYCTKKFRHKKNLVCHLLTHTGLQPYACTFCKQAFSLRYNLQTHLKNIHPLETASYEREGKPTIITSVVKKKFACGQREQPAIPMTQMTI